MRTIKLTQRKYGAGGGIGNLVTGPITLEWDTVSRGIPPDVIEYEDKWYLLRTTAPTLEYQLTATPVRLNATNCTRVITK